IPPVDGAPSYFTTPAPDDPWSGKIRGWQQSQLHTPSGPAAVTARPPRFDPIQQGSLRENYNEFVAEQKRQIARELVTWIQKQSREHYIPDGPVDHWATFEETLQNNGDDCDGLELLPNHLLRE